jgi:hypothetical protein
MPKSSRSLFMTLKGVEFQNSELAQNVEACIQKLGVENQRVMPLFKASFPGIPHMEALSCVSHKEFCLRSAS